MQNNYNQLLYKFNDSRNENIIKRKTNNLLLSYIQPPLCLLKREITQYDGKWYFKNIYENYFCFCKGKSCINQKI